MENNQQSGLVMTKEVIEQIKNGSKIQAIKLLRAEAGISLKEAKEAVDAYGGNRTDAKASINSHADIKEDINVKQPSGFSLGSVMPMVVLAIVLFVVYRII